MTADTAGGVWTYAIELARALERHGVEIVLATMGGPPPAESPPPNVVASFHATFKLEWMDDPWEDVQRAGEWLLELEARFGPSAIHLNGYAHAALPWRAPVLVVGHSCVLSWWEAVHGGPAPPVWERYREAVRSGLTAARLVVAPTRTMLEALRRHYGVRGGVVIPNAVERRVPPGSRELPSRFVLSAGRMWDDGKNVRALVEVAPRLKWPVYVAGEGAVSGGGVHALGRLTREEMALCYARAPIYALPALYEPFGLSVLEAAMSGCALVLGDIPSLRENWNGAAVFVPARDTSALEAAISRLITDAQHRTAMQHAARERARRFSPARMARAYLAAYAGTQSAEAACAS